MKKSASILDYSYPYLDPAIWDHEQKLYSYHKDFILRLLDKMYVNYKLVQPEAWITDIRIIGSLTTSKWLFTSDMDVHMVVNLTKFIELNMPGVDPKVAYEYLDATRKEFDRAKILAPMTQHPIEYYFEVPEFITTNTSMVGIYSISQDKWVKEPILFDADLDFEESKKQVMTEAESIAQALDGSFGKIDRQIDRISELEHVISAWGPDKQQLFYNKIEEKLKAIEAEILKDLELRQALIDARHAAQDPMADIEIKFKWLQRFGFFGILTNLRNLLRDTGGQVTMQELPLIKKIVTEAAKRTIKNPGIWEGQKFWSGMADSHDGQIYEVHTYEKAESAGWHHSFYTSQEAQLAMNTGDAVFFWVESDGTVNTAWGNNIENSLEGNDAPLREKIKSQISLNTKASLKEAFLKEAFEKQTLAIDFDDTIAHENEDKSIGEPQEGVKEALLKLKDDGYIIDIYSARANEDNGADEIKEWLESHEIPYDTILNVEKPIATHYIDDRAIKFTNWSDVLKQVESDKTASLHVIAKLSQKFWIDPSGKMYPFQNSVGHYGWIAENKSLLSQTYGFEFPNEYWEKIQGVEEIANTMIENNWTRVTNEGDYDFAMEVANLNSLPSYLDDFIAQVYSGHGGVEIDDLTGEYQDIEDPFPSIQKQVNKARRMRLQPVAKIFSKKEIIASSNIFEVNGILVYKNPTDQQKDNLAARAKYHSLRYMTKQDTQDKYFWDGYEADHDTMATLLGFDHSDFYKRDAFFNERVAKKITAQTKKVKQGDYSCVMALVPHELAQEIVAWGVRNVPDEELYLTEEGKLGRELESHVTIKYGLLTNDAKDVRRSFNDDKPYKAKLGKVRHFQPPELPFDVLTVEIISEDLEKANKRVTDSFDCADDLPSNEYKPHVTIAYMKRDTAKEYVGADEFEGKEIELDTVIFSPHKGNRTYFSVGTNKESSLILEKTADFLPSLFNAPDNDWQFAEGGDDKEIALNPNSVSDETTWDAPCTEGKPRSKDVWRQFISMFSNLFSKNDTSKIESALNENLVNIGTLTFRGKKTHVIKIEVPQDLLDQYFAIAIDMKRVLQDPKRQDKGFMDDKDWTKLDRTRANIHDQLAESAFNRIFEGKNWKDFPGIATEIRYKISDFVEAMVPRDDLPKESAYNPELEKAEKDALGEDETAHEYAKDFTDLNLKKTPHNTTWLNTTYQDQEPSKPLPVTYSPEMNEDNLDQNSAGGYPRRFMGKPKGEWFSNEGEVNETLIQMLRNRTAMIESTTADITKEAFLEHAYWIDPNGKVFQVRDDVNTDYTHYNWINDNEQMLKKEYGIKGNPYLNSDTLVASGWIRIGDGSGLNDEGIHNWQVQLQSLGNIPSTVDNILAQFVPEGANVEFEDNNGGFVIAEYPFKRAQIAVNRALRQQVPMAASLKEAGIEQVDGINVLVNPSKRELDGLATKLKEFVFRGLIDPKTGDLFVWDAFFSEHNQMIAKLGLEMEYSEYSPYVLYFRQIEISEILEYQQQIKQQLAQKQKQPMAASLKQAGSQSASVPDYLIDEWKTEQINNNTDEEPYVNHDQRDYPYGMHDSPENTGSGIGWPKDNQPSVVHLDTLENPAFRLDPFGIGEYHVTYYNAMPMSDGIEQMNEE